ncbi:uncharacterized protein LOC131606641 [Vicia villosa]|uniref:uncharacterized protein LOC131606641 n=1 Tax=Vicia villosa TaxID=3911 RepID=UPI00273BE9CA|nr:uncharacterized protein LOC131606641 [Vicia villosa]
MRDLERALLFVMMTTLKIECAVVLLTQETQMESPEGWELRSAFEGGEDDDESRTKLFAKVMLERCDSMTSATRDSSWTSLMQNKIDAQYYKQFDGGRDVTRSKCIAWQEEG